MKKFFENRNLVHLKPLGRHCDAYGYGFAVLSIYARNGCELSRREAESMMPTPVSWAPITFEQRKRTVDYLGGLWGGKAMASRTCSGTCGMCLHPFCCSFCPLRVPCA